MSTLDKFRNEVGSWLEANCPETMHWPAASEANDTISDTLCWGGRKEKRSDDAQRWLDEHAP